MALTAQPEARRTNTAFVGSEILIRTMSMPWHVLLDPPT